MMFVIQLPGSRAYVRAPTEARARAILVTTCYKEQRA